MEIMTNQYGGKDSAIKYILTDLGKIIHEDQYDDFEITLKGIVKDPNKFHELDLKRGNGRIGFIKYNGKKCGVEVISTRKLKDIQKILNNNKPK